MSVLIETESGATYELEKDRIRRLEGGSGNTKRQDGQWITLHAVFPNPPVVGSPMLLSLESLAAYGPDDYGTVDPHPKITTRTTTPVVKITEKP